MSNFVEDFGAMVFNLKEMQKRLDSRLCEAVFATINDGVPLENDYANALADAMKEWAIEKGATHYSHWFQPLTGTTAEKHESFLSPTKDGDIITKFRLKELLRSEPDASSFPNGGIRATFEARGYTAWDPTSYAFIKDNTLFIPTTFFSHGGEALDNKTPLMRSNLALNKQSLRILKFFRSDITRVNTSVGAEQEYFLIDKEVYKQRRDLLYTGRTLLGANPPKGQQLDDHYFGNIKPRVLHFMHDLDAELAKIGIIAKTEHNETAPAQHELVPTYGRVNLACDQNQLVMEVMKNIASRHGMHCLLHEKPFAGINGSGKHNNWSILTNTDENLFEAGNTKESNAIFLLFLTAVIKAVDEYQDLVRITVASAGNDHRLGANEAPPAVISIFVGSDLESIINSIIAGTDVNNVNHEKINIGVDCIKQISVDSTDRNRTSPFAFTGNKFEFRSLGSSDSIADTNTVLNTIVAESLRQFADVLENAENFTETLNSLIAQTLIKHQRILFNGDGYSKEWEAEAERRGLLNLKNTPVALKHLTDSKNISLFERHGIFTNREVFARQEILFEKYSKTIRIEALTLIEMIKREIVPATEKYLHKLIKLVRELAGVGVSSKKEVSKLNSIATKLESLNTLTDLLADGLDKVTVNKNAEQTALFYNAYILEMMQDIRKIVDSLETVMPKDIWPMPTYGDILYSVN